MTFVIAGDLEAKDLVPVLALVFTVASFWWIWLRRGRLTVAAPRYQASASTAQQLRIRFPLVFRNAGARSIVVEDLRLVIDGEAFDWITTRKTLRPETDDVADFAVPFVVAGREARTVIAEFGINGDTWRPDPARSYAVTLERIVRGEWKHAGAFTWWTGPAETMGSYLARRNRHEPSSV